MGFNNPFMEGGNEDPPQPLMPPMWQMSPADVMTWLDQQHPFVIKRIHYHAGWLLEQHGVQAADHIKNPRGEGGQGQGEGAIKNPPLWVKNAQKQGDEEDDDDDDGDGDTAGWYDEEAIHQGPSGLPVESAKTGKKKQQGKGRVRAGLGFIAAQNQQNPFQPQESDESEPPPPSSSSSTSQQQMQWTPAGWVVKDNSHKITTTMKPLPKPDIIPPARSDKYPEVGSDREKLRMLENNLNLMQFELTKICRKFRIVELDRDNLDSYPEAQNGRLKTAVSCVTAAEKTLNDFKEFLRDEKYKEWNEEQKKAHEEQVKAMIGETPTGVPHKKPDDDDYEDGDQRDQEAN